MFFLHIDVDECEDIKNKCAVNGHCENTLGGYRCVCDNGYEGDGINHCTGDYSILILDALI